MTRELHYVTSVMCHDIPELESPQPHYRLKPWVQPRAHDMIDTRDVHGQSEPVTAELPDGATIEDSPEGLVARRPDGAWSPLGTWPAPVDGRCRPPAESWLPE